MAATNITITCTPIDSDTNISKYTKTQRPIDRANTNANTNFTTNMNTTTHMSPIARIRTRLIHTQSGNAAISRPAHNIGTRFGVCIDAENDMDLDTTIDITDKSVCDHSYTYT